MPYKMSYRIPDIVNPSIYTDVLASMVFPTISINESREKALWKALESVQGPYTNSWGKLSVNSLLMLNTDRLTHQISEHVFVYPEHRSPKQATLRRRYYRMNTYVRIYADRSGLKLTSVWREPDATPPPGINLDDYERRGGGWSNVIDTHSPKRRAAAAATAVRIVQEASDDGMPTDADALDALLLFHNIDTVRFTPALEATP